jgi:uncharacterized protein (TIGR00725 family)
MNKNTKAVSLAAQTVGVMGSGTDEHRNLADGLGKLLASLNVNVLTGGGQGVMKSVSEAFTAARECGICIGIIPCRSEDDRTTPKAGYPNQFVELAIYTHLPFSGALGRHDLSRNHINVLSCAAIVALPGGEGTATEVSLALDYGKPIIAYAKDLSQLSSFTKEVVRVNDLLEVEEFLRRHLD